MTLRRANFGRTVRSSLLDYTEFDVLISMNRKLNPDYTGPCIELFRVSDSAIQNFDWDGDNFPISEIESWAGGSDFHINAFYNMGIDTPVKYEWNTTRAILGVGGVVNVDSDGHVYAQGVLDNGYFTIYEAPRIAPQRGVLTSDLVYSTIVKTQSISAVRGLYCEQANSGQLYHCNVIIDTSASRFAYSRRPDQATSQARVWNTDLLQNTKLMYSCNIVPIDSTNNSNSYFYRDGVFRTISTSAVAYNLIYPVGNTIRKILFRSSNLVVGPTYQEQFYEFNLINFIDRRTPDDRIFMQALRVELQNEQNSYYQIY
jgi:hypothetical protein